MKLKPLILAIALAFGNATTATADSAEKKEEFECVVHKGNNIFVAQFGTNYPITDEDMEIMQKREGVEVVGLYTYQIDESGLNTAIRINMPFGTSLNERIEVQNEVRQAIEDSEKAEMSTRPCDGLVVS